MFMLYAVAFGLLAGLATRGRVDGLTALRFRWAPLAVAGLAMQLLLFSPALTSVVGDGGAPVYVASSAIVFAVVLRNWRLPGLPIVALGAGSNLAAIVANGGWMPAGRDALAAVGATIGADYSNSREFAAPALAPLTDIYAMPRWAPFANVFSVGDVLIGVGIFLAIVLAMRGSRGAVRPDTSHEWLAETSTDESWLLPRSRHTVAVVREIASRPGTSVQGKPVARQGRKARDLPSPVRAADSPVAGQGRSRAFEVIDP